MARILTIASNLLLHWHHQKYTHCLQIYHIFYYNLYYATQPVSIGTLALGDVVGVGRGERGKREKGDAMSNLLRGL